MILLRFKCLIYVYHDNTKLYHITIMDLCDRHITLLILLHITKDNILTRSFQADTQYTELSSSIKPIV